VIPIELGGDPAGWLWVGPVLGAGGEDAAGKEVEIVLGTAKRFCIFRYTPESDRPLRLVYETGNL
jgi:hypothetical protein